MKLSNFWKTSEVIGNWYKLNNLIIFEKFFSNNHQYDDDYWNNLLHQVLLDFQTNKEFRNIFNDYTNKNSNLISKLLVKDKTYQLIFDKLIFQLEKYTNESGITWFDINIDNDTYSNYENEFDNYKYSEFEKEEDDLISLFVIDTDIDEEITMYFIDNKFSHAYNSEGDYIDIEDSLIEFLENKLLSKLFESELLDIYETTDSEINFTILPPKNPFLVKKASFLNIDLKDIREELVDNLNKSKELGYNSIKIVQGPKVDWDGKKAKSINILKSKKIGKYSNITSNLLKMTLINIDDFINRLNNPARKRIYYYNDIRMGKPHDRNSFFIQ